MEDVSKITPTNILALLQFVAPGFLIFYFRSLFVTRRQAAFKDNLLFFITMSVIYGFATLPLVGVMPSTGTGGFLRWLIWLFTLVIVPVGLGVLAGLAVQRGWFAAFLARLGLRMISPYPTGWDWAFASLGSRPYVIVTLSDGAQVFGYFGHQSLAASDVANKDIFIEELYDLVDGLWSPRKEKQGIWIAGVTIRHIEFITPA